MSASAGAFAERRTDTAGKLREAVGFSQSPVRVFKMTLIQKIVKLGDQVGKRAARGTTSQEHTGLAERNAAVHAARALGPGRFFTLVHLMYFAVIMDTLFDITIRADGSFVLQESGVLTH